MPLAKLRLLARVLGRVELRPAGASPMTSLTRDDYAAAGADDGDSEGIIDHLRAVAGRRGRRRDPRAAATAAGPREGLAALVAEGRRLARSRARFGGGGHPQAAGFSSDATNEEIVAAVEREVVALG